VKRSAVARITIVAVLAVLIMAGAVGIYYYTSAPPGTNTNTTTSSSQTSGNTAGAGPSGGSQDANLVPHGAWSDYLGYVPSGYKLAPHYTNAATYPCPPGMGTTQCALFQKSCGNGVCDPNESCATCPIDCGVSGLLTCDPYTGRAGGPASVCQMAGHA